MNILYEDEELLVCEKPRNVASENTGDKKGLADLLAAHTGGYIATVHRLDFGVEGVMVYAKTQTAAAILSSDLQNQSLQKEYLAVAEGSFEEKSGEWKDLLFHDRLKNKSFLVDRKRSGVKEAILQYEVLSEGSVNEEQYSLVRIKLLTGRTHQIRTQFSGHGHPLLGDRKYGSKTAGPIGLACIGLQLCHPTGRMPMDFSWLPTDEPWISAFPNYFTTNGSKLPQ